MKQSSILSLLLLPFTSAEKDDKDLITTQCGAHPCKGVDDTKSSGSQCRNKFLGPKEFKTADNSRWGDMFVGYSPLGSYCPQSFLEQYVFNGSYIYPEHDGALLDSAGKPITHTYTLPEGMELDRFGTKYGGYLAPKGTPFAWRAIPPGNLNSYPDSPLYNYWVWRVIESFNVTGGPIAPWFGQPGYGLQFYHEGGLKELEGTYLELVSSPSLERDGL